MAAEVADAGLAGVARGRGKVIPVIVVALLMGAEGVAIFFLAKAISPDPASAVAALAGNAGEGAGDTDQDGLAEIEIAECRPSNIMTGKFVMFHIRVSALVSANERERAEKMVRARRARLEDGVNTVIRAADPKHLNEPGLETVKRRLRHEFSAVFGDEDLVKEVLIPQLLQSRPGV